MTPESQTEIAEQSNTPDSVHNALSLSMDPRATAIAQLVDDNTLLSKTQLVYALYIRAEARRLLPGALRKLNAAVEGERDTAKLTNAVKMLESVANGTGGLPERAGSGVSFTIQFPDGGQQTLTVSTQPQAATLPSLARSVVIDINPFAVAERTVDVARGTRVHLPSALDVDDVTGYAESRVDVDIGAGAIDVEVAA